MAIKKNTGSVSKVLSRKGIEAASFIPGAKSINVYDGHKGTYIPNTSANRTQLTKLLGKPNTSKYRGKTRVTWLDRSIY